METDKSLISAALSVASRAHIRTSLNTAAERSRLVVIGFNRSVNHRGSFQEEQPKGRASLIAGIWS